MVDPRALAVPPAGMVSREAVGNPRPHIIEAKMNYPQLKRWGYLFAG